MTKNFQLSVIMVELRTQEDAATVSSVAIVDTSTMSPVNADMGDQPPYPHGGLQKMAFGFSVEMPTMWRTVNTSPAAAVAQAVAHTSLLGK